MTDMPEHHEFRSFAAARPRSALSATLDAVRGLYTTAVAHVRRPAFEDLRARAERARLADRQREAARRKVDRLLI